MPHPTVFSTRAKGKLLLSGEYAVLDGALALALPVRFGQSLRVAHDSEASGLHWTSRDSDGSVWFEAEFALPGLDIQHSSNVQTAEALLLMLKACRAQKPEFLSQTQGLRVWTDNDFPRAWGLGTSSTLIAALGRWAGVDPYRVLFETLGGSGYDIACAYAEGPILYQLSNGMPQIQDVDFQPPFAENLYFIYLGKKQDSRAGIHRYRARAGENTALIAPVSQITEQLLAAQTLTAFETALLEHEHLISRALNLERAQDLYFPGYWGVIKSLGAWGGDFVLATSARPEAETKAYFAQKGFEVFLPWAVALGQCR